MGTQLLEMSITSLIFMAACIYHTNSAVWLEHGPCPLGNGKYGNCSQKQNCKSINAEVQNPNFNAVTLTNKLCGFNDLSIPLFCCPDKIIIPEAPNSIGTRADSRGPLITYKNPFDTSTGNRLADTECKRYTINSPHHLILNIVNGKPTELGEFPHMAALIYNYAETPWRCGGALISDRYVLTAAHCFKTEGPIKVILGTNDLKDSENAREYEIEENIPHPNYVSSLFYYDIGLIRLKEQVNLTSALRPACLNTDPNLLIPASLLTVTGFGKIGGGNNDPQSSLLLQTNLTYIPQDVCNCTYINERPNESKLPYGLDSGQFCAQGTLTEDQLISDSCAGDSGGPLQIRDIRFGNTSVIFGIVSLGETCPSKLPGLYTNVYYYLDWIESTVWRKN